MILLLSTRNLLGRSSRLGKNRGPRRGGFYLRELVVFLVAPLVLLSLVFPAIHRVREAARRMQCSSQLKQLGIAASNHMSVFQVLPSGVYARDLLTITDTDPLHAESYFGWSVPLLPYLDNHSVYPLLEQELQSGSMSNSIADLESRAAMQIPMTYFLCPSDQNAPPLNFGRSMFDQKSEIPLAYSSYVGVNGSGDLWRKNATRGANGANGIFYLNSRIRFEDITDGISNTLMIGERAWSRPRGSFSRPIDSRGALLFGTRSARERSWIGLADVLGSGKFKVNFNAIHANGELGLSYARRAFSSLHPGGANFIFADASIRFVSDSIDSGMDVTTQLSKTEAEVDSVWERLLSRNDGYVGPDGE